MKTNLALLALIVGALFASAQTTTVSVAPGQKVLVSGISGVGVSVGSIGVRHDAIDAQDAQDVVKALNILLKFAPSKYPEAQTSFTSSAYLNFGSIVRTKADGLRAEADEIEHKAKTARADADRIDKEQADIEWARGILRKWEARVELLK